MNQHPFNMQFQALKMYGHKPNCHFLPLFTFIIFTTNNGFFFNHKLIYNQKRVFYGKKKFHKKIIYNIFIVISI